MLQFDSTVVIGSETNRHGMARLALDIMLE